MVNIVCDSCKKSITNARKDHNYTSIRYKNLCMECKKELENTVSDKMKEKETFSIKEYNEEMLDVLKEMCR